MVKYITWIMTNKCNYRCPYCHVPNIVEREDEIEDDNFIDAFNYLLPELIDISGGEPTLHKGFYNIINNCSDRVKFALTTNMSFDIIKFINNTTPKSFISITASFHPSMINCDVFIGKILYLKSLGYPISAVNFVAYPSQMYMINEYYEVFRSHNFLFHVDPYRDDGTHGFNYNKQELSFLKYYVNTDRLYYINNESESKPCLCNAGNVSIHLRPDGKVYRCYADFFEKLQPIGHISSFNGIVKDTTCNNYNKCVGCDRDKVTVKFL